MYSCIVTIAVGPMETRRHCRGHLRVAECAAIVLHVRSMPTGGSLFEEFGLSTEGERGIAETAASTVWGVSGMRWYKGPNVT